MDLKDFKIELGKNIAHTRKKKGMTQQELGALLDKDFQSISRIENGKVNISAHLLFEIAKSLGANVNDLIDFSKSANK